MKNKLFMFMAFSLFFVNCGTKNTITPVPFNQVTLTDGFWKQRMKTEIDVTVPFSVQHCIPAIERFRQCSSFLRKESSKLPIPHPHISSDMYKVMEGVAYSLMIQPDKELEEFMDSTIQLIGECQQPDGYLYITHICGNPIPEVMGNKPYTKIIYSHELYDMGHLYEAAAAYYQATGKRTLLDIAIKNARHINRVFFEGDPNYNDGKPIMQAPGHEEIELALCKLYRITGDRLFLNMAKKFLDIRGVTYCPNEKNGTFFTYSQQHKPVAEQREAVGHAVRAAYLYTSMAQVDALTGLNDYGKALNSIWNDLVSTRMHITGGLGAVSGIEGFGAHYELPNLTAYNETCAAVANVFFNHSMYLNTRDAKYLDIAELSLFNNALAGISLRGDRFFYVNPLEANGNNSFNEGIGGRSEWFDCACCPPNISRLILQIPGYMYSYDKNGIYLTLYGSSRTDIMLDGVKVSLDEKSNYPFDGKVHLKVDPERSKDFALHFRIPTWAHSEQFVPGGLYRFKDKIKLAIKLTVNGKKVSYNMKNGFAVINRKWNKGDVMELELPMPARFVDCSDKVIANVGRTAVTRGPLVYCAEEVDNGIPVQNLYLGDGKKQISESVFDSGIMKGITSISFDGMSEKKVHGITMVPYYSWCNRGDNQSMIVWINDKYPYHPDREGQ